MGTVNGFTLKYKRGTAEQNDYYTGYEGEITVDTTNRIIRVHDGVNAGGRRITPAEGNLLEKIEIENLIEGELFLHSGSSDHDSRYYKKGYLDGLTEGLINLKENTIHAQDVLQQVGEGEYGWVDNVADIVIRSTGNAAPAWEPFRSGVYGYRFEAGRLNECWANFHINHDYAMGTPVFPHMHWVPEDNSTGTVRWGFEYTVAKGHAQGAGSVYQPTSIIYAETEITEGSEFMHFVTETSDASAIPADKLEPDSIILMRFFRDGVNDTYPSGVFGLKTDIHYQAARFATKNKAPNFFGD